MNIEQELRKLVDLERTLRATHRAILEVPAKQVVASLQGATGKTAALSPEDRICELVPMATLAGLLDVAESIDVLLPMLSVAEPEVRLTAGEAMLALMESRFSDVEARLEKLLPKLSPGDLALVEVPYILGETGAPECLGLLDLLLKNKDTEAVVAAIEAMVEIGDPAAIPMLRRLEKDGRMAMVESDEGEDESVAIGALASEACELLEEGS
jgi:hypothetical protein